MRRNVGIAVHIATSSKGRYSLVRAVVAIQQKRREETKTGQNETDYRSVERIQYHRKY